MVHVEPDFPSSKKALEAVSTAEQDFPRSCTGAALKDKILRRASWKKLGSELREECIALLEIMAQFLGLPGTFQVSNAYPGSLEADVFNFLIFSADIHLEQLLQSNSHAVLIKATIGWICFNQISCMTPMRGPPCSM
jgi:hypothetical protein